MQASDWREGYIWDFKDRRQADVIERVIEGSGGRENMGDYDNSFLSIKAKKARLQIDYLNSIGNDQYRVKKSKRATGENPYYAFTCCYNDTRDNEGGTCSYQVVFKWAENDTAVLIKCVLDHTCGGATAAPLNGNPLKKRRTKKMSFLFAAAPPIVQQATEAYLTSSNPNVKCFHDCIATNSPGLLPTLNALKE